MKRIIIAITGATGVIYGIRLLQTFQEIEDIEAHLVISKPGMQTLAYETEWRVKDLQQLADRVYSNNDIGAAISSGSFQTSGMIIAPCSMNTLASISQGICDKLIPRAADVMLKERRRLVLMVRETPLHYGHLKNMLLVTQMGAIVAPPVPAFYHQPQSVNDIVDHSIGRILDLFYIEHDLVSRWKETPASFDKTLS